MARCLSHYCFEKVRNNNPIDFLPWLEQNANYQSRILSGRQDANAAIAILESRIEFVGIVEAFDESIQLLRHWSGVDLVRDYRSRNVAKYGWIKRMVLAEPGNAEAIEEFNRIDKVVYRYARNELYPRLRSQLARSQAGTPRSAIALPITMATAKRDLLYKPAAKNPSSMVGLACCFCQLVLPGVSAATG